MKKLLLLCCAVMGITAAGFAQGGGGRMQPTPQQQTDRLKTSLALTDDQTAKVLAIYTAQAKSNDSLRTAANGDMQSARPAMMAIRTATTAKIKAVLTADQATKFDADQAAMRNRGGGGGGMGGGGGGGTPPPPSKK